MLTHIILSCPSPTPDMSVSLLNQPPSIFISFVLYYEPMGFIRVVCRHLGVNSFVFLCVYMCAYPSVSACTCVYV